MRYSYNDKGQTTKEEQQYDSTDNDVKLTTEYTYNGYGSMSSIKETWANTANNGLSATSRMTTIAESYSNNQRTLVTTNPLGHVNTEVFDPRFAKAVSVTDANNQTITTAYDNLGRPTESTLPDGTKTVFAYKRCSNCDMTINNHNTTWYVQSKTAGLSASRSYFDSMDRNIGSRSKGLNGDFNYNYSVYDRFGRQVKVVSPFREGETQQSSTNQYDVLSRLISTTLPDGSVESIAYTAPASNGYAKATTVMTNSLSQNKTQVFNSRGQEKVVTDALQTEVRYDYDAQGNLAKTEVEDRDGNKVTHRIEYDVLGRKTKLIDPDTGTIDYKYNALGLLSEQKDAMNQITRYTYDQLGRQLTRTDLAGTASAQTHRWEYDTATLAGTTLKGLLAKVTGVDTDNRAFAEHYTYNSDMRLVETRTIINGEEFTLSQSYDSFGRANTITYPSGHQVANGYNQYGHLDIIKRKDNNSLYWSATEDDAFGNITGYTNGDGLKTIKTFDSQTGLINSIHASFHTSSIVQDHEYAFDSEGNLSWRKDNKANVTEHFCYDDLNRLTNSSANGSCLGGKSTTYDYHGNITSKSDIQNGATYAYGAGSAGPHAVTSIGGGTNNYSYNANGEMLSGGGRTGITYTPYGKPKHVQKGSYITNITYGPNKNRIQRVDSSNANGSETTIYIGKLYEKVTANGQTKLKHYIGGMAIFTQTINVGVNSDHTIYLYKDHIGSVVAKTAKSQFYTGIIDTLANEPWGRQLNDSWNGTLKADSYNPQDTDLGYTGHEHMTGVGLIHMNGRVYDPIIGRFMSPDPYIQDPSNSQSFNRYTYVFNNPHAYTDPTGEIGIAGGILGSGIGAASAFIFEAAVQLSTDGELNFTELAASAAGGAAAGAVIGATGGASLLIASAAGAAGAGTSSVVREVNKEIVSGDGSLVNVFKDSALGAIGGAATGKILKLVKLNKLPAGASGKFSITALEKQIITKLNNGTIKLSSLSTKTIAKLIALGIIVSAPAKEVNAVVVSTANTLEHIVNQNINSSGITGNQQRHDGFNFAHFERINEVNSRIQRRDLFNIEIPTNTGTPRTSGCTRGPDGTFPC